MTSFSYSNSGESMSGSGYMCLHSCHLTKVQKTLLMMSLVHQISQHFISGHVIRSNGLSLHQLLNIMGVDAKMLRALVHDWV